jgi:hypothetical protein
VKKFLFLFGLIMVVFVGAALASVAGEFGQPAFDPAEYARQQAEADRLARASEIDAQLQGLDLALAAAWRVLPLAVAVAIVVGAGAWGSLALIRFRRERWPRDNGLLPVELFELPSVGAAALGAFHTARIAEAQRQPVPHSLNFSPHYNRTDSAGALATPAIELPAAAPALPGLTDLAALSFRPTVDRILLGLGPDGQQFTVPMKALWHIGTAGPTGAGKSNIARLILPQLQSLGAKVCIGDPKWTPFDHESGEDWRPIAERLHLAPARKADEIAGLIGYFHDELERRLELRHAGQKVGGPLFLYLDEYTTITEDVKDAGEHVARLGRLGRGVGIFLLVAAHDLLVKSGAGDTRDQIRTGFYLGGDVKTGSVLLDLPQRAVIEREGELTTGLALLRSAATSPAQLVRVPYASNAGIASLLGVQEASAEASQDRPIGFRRPSSRKPDGSLTEARDAQASGAPGSAEAARALALFQQGLDIAQIVKELYGIDAGAGGRRYQDAAREVQRLLREALGGI